ncbi:MAG: hypothetical protein WAO76_18410 [Georgfuchsia sp.]
MNNSKNDPETAVEDADVDWQKIVAGLASALNSCITQIDQMRGLFVDTDGTIEEALNAAEEAVDAYHSHCHKHAARQQARHPVYLLAILTEFRKPAA